MKTSSHVSEWSRADNTYQSMLLRLTFLLQSRFTISCAQFLSAMRKQYSAALCVSNFQTPHGEVEREGRILVARSFQKVLPPLAERFVREQAPQSIKMYVGRFVFFVYRSYFELLSKKKGAANRLANQVLELEECLQKGKGFSHVQT